MAIDMQEPYRPNLPVEPGWSETNHILSNNVAVGAAPTGPSTYSCCSLLLATSVPPSTGGGLVRRSDRLSHPTSSAPTGGPETPPATVMACAAREPGWRPVVAQFFSDSVRSPKTPMTAVKLMPGTIASDNPMRLRINEWMPPLPGFLPAKNHIEEATAPLHGGGHEFATSREGLLEPLPPNAMSGAGLQAAATGGGGSLFLPSPLEARAPRPAVGAPHDDEVPRIRVSRHRGVGVSARYSSKLSRFVLLSDDLNFFFSGNPISI